MVFAAPPAPHLPCKHAAGAAKDHFETPILQASTTHSRYGDLRKKAHTTVRAFRQLQTNYFHQIKKGSALHYGAEPLKHRNTPRTRRANQHPIRLSPGRMRRQSPYPCRNTYSRPPTSEHHVALLLGQLLVFRIQLGIALVVDRVVRFIAASSRPILTGNHRNRRLLLFKMLVLDDTSVRHFALSVVHHSVALQFSHSTVSV